MNARPFLPIFILLWFVPFCSRADLPPGPIPALNQYQALPGTFSLGNETAIVSQLEGTDTAEALTAELSRITGFRHRVFHTDPGLKHPLILLPDPKMTPGAFRFHATPEAVVLSGRGAEEIHAAGQAFFQSLPVERLRPGQTLEITCRKGSAEAPAFPVRGLHLDLASHLLPTKGLESLIDQLARHRFNTLVLLLNNAHGWRLELPEFPELIAQGATRPSSDFDPSSRTGHYAGHYTLNDWRRLRNYAATRHVTLIPSFTLVEGADPLTAAFPHLAAGKGPAQANFWQQEPFTLPENPAVKAFHKKLLRALAKHLPGGQIHFNDQRQRITKHLESMIEDEGIRTFPMANLYITDFSLSQLPVEFQKVTFSSQQLLTAKEVFDLEVPKDKSGFLAFLDTSRINTFPLVMAQLWPRMAALSESTYSQRSNFPDFKIRWDYALPYFRKNKLPTGWIYQQPTRGTVFNTLIETDWKHQDHHWPELAIDGRSDTYFLSESSLPKGSHFDFLFPVPVSGRIQIQSGAGFFPEARLESAVLETSSDGVNWQFLAPFVTGKVETALSSDTRFLRIRLLEAQSHPVLIQEISLSQHPILSPMNEKRIFRTNSGHIVPMTFQAKFPNDETFRTGVYQLREAFFEITPKLLTFKSHQKLQDLTLEVLPNQKIDSTWLRTLSGSEARQWIAKRQFQKLQDVLQVEGHDHWLTQGFIEWLATAETFLLCAYPGRSPQSSPADAAAFIAYLHRYFRPEAVRRLYAALWGLPVEQLDDHPSWMGEMGYPLDRLIKTWQNGKSPHAVR